MSQDSVRARAMGEPEEDDLISRLYTSRDNHQRAAARNAERLLAAWRALPEDMRGTFNRDHQLADAVAALVGQRDRARETAAVLEEENALLSWLHAESEWKRTHPTPLFDRVKHRRGFMADTLNGVGTPGGSSKAEAEAIEWAKAQAGKPYMTAEQRARAADRIREAIYGTLPAPSEREGDKQ